MNLKAVTMEAEGKMPSHLWFYREVAGCEHNQVILRRFNEMLKDREHETAVLVLLLYPAVSWVLSMKGEQDKLFEILRKNNDRQSEGAEVYQKFTRLILEISEEPNIFALDRKRKEFLDGCESLVRDVDNAINKLRAFPEQGRQFADLLEHVIGVKHPGHKKINCYHINKGLAQAISLFEKCLKNEGTWQETVLTGKVLSDEDVGYICKQMMLVLQELKSMSWFQQYGDESNAELATFLKLAKTLLRGIKNIHTAGDQLDEILCCIMYWKFQGTSDEVMADMLNLSTYNFSVRKRKLLQFSAANLALFSGDVFVRILTEKN